MTSGSSTNGDVPRSFVCSALLGDEAHMSSALTAMADPATGLAGDMFWTRCGVAE